MDVAARDTPREAIALHVDAVEAHRDGTANRARRARFHAPQVVIADVELAADFRLEARLGGDDRNEAGRSIAAEQCPLRTAQDLDAVERAKLGQAHTCTRAVNAVDEDADRAFEAGVVADRADAADRATASPPSEMSTNEAKGDLVELPDVCRVRCSERTVTALTPSASAMPRCAASPYDAVAGFDRLRLDSRSETSAGLAVAPSSLRCACCRIRVAATFLAEAGAAR